MNDKKAIIRHGKIIYGVSAGVSKINDTLARAKRESMKVNHRKDLLQRNQVEYYKAFPDQAKNLSDEARRLLS